MDVDIMKQGGYAFPGPAGAERGMTLRDWFAGQALVGVLGRGIEMGDVAIRLTYEIADKLLEHRGKGG